MVDRSQQWTGSRGQLSYVTGAKTHPAILFLSAQPH